MDYSLLPYRFGNSVLDPARGSLSIDGKPIKLRPKAYDLLRFLLDNPGRLVPKDELIEAIWPGISVGDESLAQCISEIRAAIADREQAVIKTVPRRGYMFAGLVTRTAAEAVMLPALVPPNRPSIAVLPFANFGGDPAHEYLCDGLTEDIITELSRFHELFVVARNSTFQYKGRAVDIRTVGRELGVRYVLEGSVRSERDRIRVTAQLVDATSGGHRWADRYDHAFTDSFSVQDKIARTIASVLASTVNRAEIEYSAARPATDWQAYDYYLRATAAYASYSATYNVEELYETRRLLHKSISVDPRYSRAYGRLSHSHVNAYFNAVDGDFLNPAALDLAYDYAVKAVHLDPASPLAHADLGYVSNWKHGYDAAVAEFERAIALNPNFSDHRFPFMLTFACDFERAISEAKVAMRIDPFFPGVLLAFSGLAHYMRNEYFESYSQLRESVTRTNNRAARVWLAATCARMGRHDEARRQAAEVLRILPSYTISGVGRRLVKFKYPEADEHFFEGLRLAGLPEKPS